MIDASIYIHGAEDICALKLRDVDPVSGQFYFRIDSAKLTIWASAEELREMAERLFKLSNEVMIVETRRADEAERVAEMMEAVTS